MFFILNRLLNKIKRKRYEDIDPDLVFLDSKNLPNFNEYQFEGRMEKPISNLVFYILSIFFILVVCMFLYRFWDLQIINNKKYKEISENNKLRQTAIFAPRGIIFSREGNMLAHNDIGLENQYLPKRKYINMEGFGHLLGFIKYPAKDKYGFYYEKDFIPKDGLELYLNEILAGKNGIELSEVSVSGEVISKNIINLPKKGEDVAVSIDSRVQNKLYDSIKNLSNKVNFEGGAGAIMDIHSGEILAMTSFPEYDSNLMTEGSDKNIINGYYQDKNNPFLNRFLSGLYTPGSIIKPFVAFSALEEKVISPEKEIVSTGSLVIPNKYDKDKPTIFKDWKAHGATDMRKAIAVSSDVYFYQIGGGFNEQKGLGINNIKKYLEMFGFTKQTAFDYTKEGKGVIPDPSWKEENFKDIWRVGDTYNTAIGQYGMQITPIQALVAVSALANGGILKTPSIIFTATSTKIDGQKIKGSIDNFKIVKEGMRLAVKEGTAKGLDIEGLEIAAKTGTAELGLKKQFVNSWVIGFFPYEKPKYAFVVVMEKGPVKNLTGATFVMREVIDWIILNTPEYVK